MENGIIPKEFLRVAKRICARAKKAGGRPAMECVGVKGGRAYATDGAIVIRIDGTGTDAAGYVDPKPLVATKAGDSRLIIPIKSP